jgi:hypothetical protein
MCLRWHRAKRDNELMCSKGWCVVQVCVRVGGGGWWFWFGGLVGWVCAHHCGREGTFWGLDFFFFFFYVTVDISSTYIYLLIEYEYGVLLKVRGSYLLFSASQQGVPL